MDIPGSKLINTNSLSIKKQPVFKKQDNYMEAYKQQIIKWMITLNQMQRASVMVITDTKMLGYINSMMNNKYESLWFCYTNQPPDIYFRQFCKYKPKQFSLQQIHNSHRDILNNIVILKSTGQITFKRSFLNQHGTLLRHISVMTNNLMFTCLNTNSNFLETQSVWFRQRQFHSICEWIIYAFENEIAKHFIKRSQTILYHPIVQLFSIKDYLIPLVRINYFSLEKIKKLYKDKRIQDNEEGKKNRQLNIHKILDLLDQKDDEQLADDILLNRLKKHEDNSYIIYTQILYKLVRTAYQNTKIDQMMKMADQIQSKQKTEKKKKKKKKRKQNNNKQQIDEKETTDVTLKDTDDTLTQTKSINEQTKNSSIISQQSKEQLATKQVKVKYVQKKQVKQQFSLNKEQKQKEITNGQQVFQNTIVKKKKKIRQQSKRINLYLNKFLRDYIDDFSHSSNRLINHRKMVFNRLQTTIIKILKQQQIYFESSLKLFGSCALGLSTEESDIDMVLKLNTQQNIDYIVLQIIYNQLEKQKWVSNRKLINSSIPLLKLQIDLLFDFPQKNSKYNIQSLKKKKDIPKFQVDLSIETKATENHQGISTTQFSSNLLQKYSIIRQITLLLKIVIKARNLHLTFHGGINSYVLFLLVYAFLKNQNLLESTEIFTPLISLLDFYSKFNIESTLIDLCLQKPIVLVAPLLQKLTIIDPLSQKEKYINTNSSKIDKIFDLFKQLNSILLQTKSQLQQAPDLSQNTTGSAYSNFKYKLDELMIRIF